MPTCPYCGYNYPQGDKRSTLNADCGKYGKNVMALLQHRTDNMTAVARMSDGELAMKAYEIWGNYNMGSMESAVLALVLERAGLACIELKEVNKDENSRVPAESVNTPHITHD